MDETSLSDEIALKCDELLQATKALVQLADELFTMIESDSAARQETHLRMGVFNLRGYAQSWIANQYIDYQIINQAKDCQYDEF